jgi:hypothetical protein
MSLPKLLPTPKLLLGIVTGGVLLGVLGGQLASPVMKFADEPDWRGRFAAHFSDAPAQFADAGPEDLTPLGWFGPGYTRPVEYVPPADYVVPAEYAPVSPDHYAPAAEPEAYPPAEVEQASTEATEAAAVLTEPQSAAVFPATSEAAAQAPLVAPAPLAGQMASADKNL